MPRRAPVRARATDLTAPATTLYALSGTPVQELARATLEASRRLLETWTELEPIAKQLTAKVRKYVEGGKVTGPEAGKMLSATAGVIHKMGAAAQGVLRASEGQHRLALLLAEHGGKPHPAQMSEKKLAEVVIEAARKIAKDQGHCPICERTKAIPVATVEGPESVQ